MALTWASVMRFRVEGYQAALVAFFDVEGRMRER